MLIFKLDFTLEKTLIVSVKYSSLDFGLKVGFAVSKVRASLAAILSLGKIATQPDVRIRVLEAARLFRGLEAARLASTVS